MSDEIQEFKTVVGNTRTPLGAQLYQLNSAGTYAAVDLTAHTVKFTMVDEDGNAVVSEAAADVIDAITGKVQYDFQAADVATAGNYYGWFTIYDGSNETDSFPVGGRKLRIRIDAKV